MRTTGEHHLRMLSIRSALALFAFPVLVFPAAASADVPIVYTRCVRTDAPVDVTMDVTVDGVTRSATRTMRGLDVYDILPDVTHFLGGFSAPCDLVYRDEAGSERVLYDCSSESTDEAACAAMDPAVSFDARTIAFTVFRGSLEAHRETIRPRVIDPRADDAPYTYFETGGRTLKTSEAQLHLVDVATGEVTALPHTAGTFDTGPAFLPNGRLSFTSTRDGNRSTVVFHTTASRVGVRIWAMDLDGRNADLSSHHSTGVDEHPLVLRDGRVAYTSWQVFGGLPFRHTNGSPGGFTTLDNLFHVYTQRPDGAEVFAFYGQHSGDHTPVTSTHVTHNASHFLAQTSDGYVWFSDYYRANNNGLGEVIGVLPEPAGQEGFGPEEITAYGDMFAPRHMRRAAMWATNGDGMARPMEAPAFSVPTYADPLPFAGKPGHPAALPDNGLMIAWGKGACSTVAGSGIFRALGREAPPLTDGSGSGTATNVITSLELDTPGCDSGLYRLTTIPSMHPNDLELIVDSREWHELQGRAVVPYSAIFGVERPDLIERSDRLTSHPMLELGTPFGLLGAASMIDRETHPRGGITFQGEHQFHNQGTDTIDYTDADLCGLRILGIMPNRGDVNAAYREIANVAGERVRILGEIPVRNRDASGRERLDPAGNVDTSFLVRMPANMPYLMQGIDCDGRTLNTDQTWQSLRPGEMKTCGGCHVHSRESLTTFDRTFAATSEYEIPRLGEGTVPLLSGREGDGSVLVREVEAYGLEVNFQNDVMPIFERRCTSCHGGESPAAGLALDRPGTGSDDRSTWFCLVSDNRQSCVPEALQHDTGAGSTSRNFRRPQLTRYVRAFNALGSLLYWKAAGRRTDGRTDDTYGESDDASVRDIDFGAAHTTSITPEELGLLSRWIDLGSPGGPMESRDTQRPTLNLVASVEGESVTALHVGTTDLGSGIDTSSLELCVLDATGECTAPIALEAAPHGVVTHTLASPLTDLDTEVRARVSDLEGNETIAQWTVRWLLDAPPPPLPIPEGVDGGGVRRDGSVGGDDAPRGEDCSCSAPGQRRTTPPWLGLSLLAGIALLGRRRVSRRRASRRRALRAAPPAGIVARVSSIRHALPLVALTGLCTPGCGGGGDAPDAWTTERDATPSDDAAASATDAAGEPEDASAPPRDGGPPPTPDPRANPRLAELPENTALHLGVYECASRMPQISNYCQSIFDYSRFNYDPYNHRVLLFGGGHSATGRTDVDVFDPDTLTWQSLYPSMSCEDVSASDLDPIGFYRATGHPFARHTYDLNVIAEVDGVGRFVMLEMSAAAGTCHPDVGGSAIPWLELTPGNTTWAYADRGGAAWNHGASAEFDPPSGRIVLIGQGAHASAGGMRVIDPRTGDISGTIAGVTYDGQIDHNLLYYPPTQTMFLINREDRGNGMVMEVTLDREDWSRSTSRYVETHGAAPEGGGTTGWAYDPRHEVFGGGVRDGRFFTFDPSTSTWSSEEMNVLNEDDAARPTQLVFHNLDYDPVNNVYYFITGTYSGYHMWAYRYRD